MKAIKQRFVDFQTKLKVWRNPNFVRARKRQKTRLSKNIERINERFKSAAQNFTAEQDLMSETKQLFDDFAEHSRQALKNEKTLINFMCGLPEIA